MSGRGRDCVSSIRGWYVPGGGSRALALFVYRSSVSVNRRMTMSANRGDLD